MTRTKIILAVFIFLVLALVFGGSYFFVNKYQSIVVRPLATPTPASAPTPDPNRDFSVLLLGYGGGAHDGGKLTDSIILAKVSPKNKKITLISIPRDLWVPIPIGTSTPYFAKINSAYSIGSDETKFLTRPQEYQGDAGGGTLAKKIVFDVTGIMPDYFISVDFSAFIKVVDLLGGVDVNVQRSFVDNMYPIEDKKDDTCGKSPEEVAKLTSTLTGLKLEEQFPCRYEVLEFKKGIVHMDGATALKYVRSRHSSTDGGDFNRASRQRQFLLAVTQKVVSLNFFSKAIPLLNTLTSHVKTDISLPDLEKLLARGMEFASYQIDSLALTGDNVLKDSWSSDRQSILVSLDGIGNFDSIKSFIASPSSFIRPKNFNK